LPAPQPPSAAPATAVGFALDATVGTFHLHVSHPANVTRLAIVGPSGSGKSLTLRGLAGLLGPDAGLVTFGGADVSRVVPDRRNIGYVPQGFGLIPGLTVRQQVVFGVRADPARAAWWVTTLHLDELLDRYPEELSGGQRQRVSLARALAGEPQVVLLDEPFSALDAPVRDELRRELRRLQLETGLSTVVVTHDPEEAAFLAEEIVVIDDGAVLQAGTVAEVYRRPVSRHVGRLLGIDNLRTATSNASGALQCGQITIATAIALPAGTAVLWRIPADQLMVQPTGAGHPAVVLDIVDVGVAVEVSVLVGDALPLRARCREPTDLRPGQPCVVQLDPAAVSVWPAENHGED
jgi:ABC-type sulfate/molybdate transport systems ATPase subunit